MSKSILCNQINQMEIYISFVSNEEKIYDFKCNTHNLCEELPTAIVNCREDLREFLLSNFSINDLIVNIDDKHNITSKRILISFFTGLLR